MSHRLNILMRMATSTVVLRQRGQKSRVPHQSPEVAAAQSFPLAGARWQELWSTACVEPNSSKGGTSTSYKTRYHALDHRNFFGFGSRWISGHLDRHAGDGQGADRPIYGVAADSQRLGNSVHGHRADFRPHF